MRTGIDIDGVLAAFYPAYEELTIRVSGEDRFGDKKYPNQLPKSWNWPEDQFGYSKATMAEVWNQIRASSSFWTMLQPMPEYDRYLDWLLEAQSHDIYYVTDRSGVYAKRQTEDWFDRHGIPFATVLISKHKGLIAKGLGLDLYIDDKGENIQDVERDSPKTVAILLNRPYNAKFMVKQRRDTLLEGLSAKTTP